MDILIYNIILNLHEESHAYKAFLKVKQYNSIFNNIRGDFGGGNCNFVVKMINEMI